MTGTIFTYNTIFCNYKKFCILLLCINKCLILDRYEKLKNREWQTMKKIDIHRERELRKMFLDGAEDKKFKKEEWEDNK